MDKSLICPTSIYERYTYLMAPYITPNDNTGYKQRIEQSIIESYYIERDYLLTKINRLERKINLLRFEQIELRKWIRNHSQSNKNSNNHSHRHNHRSTNQWRKYSKRQKKILAI
ncbi:hypothetical protein DERP_008086 [Dermatophagoides pteronyssinus]|uniref:Uncharacterized protein n=1 Tax=Dermatophagoides pteronyssinus TaxID=6956 RepID=A0ABQ8JK55_DERPT|nr:hypothetical protein DERP_008086 [Dermatophagoides pteronyssinus]